MGAIAGALEGISKRVYEENMVSQMAQIKANDDMAEMFMDRAKRARTPEEEIELHQLAAQYRSLGAKKPGKDLNPYDIFTNKNKELIGQHFEAQKKANSEQEQQKQQQIGQAQGTVAQGILPPPSPDNTQLPGGGRGSQEKQIPSGISGMISGSFDGGVAAPQQVPTAPQKPIIPGVSMQAGSDNPPPTSGLPAPGFNAQAPSNTPLPAPVAEHRDPFRGFDEQQEFEARGEGLKASAHFDAQFGAQTHWDAQKIEQRKKILQESPELFGDLEPFEKAQFVLGGTISRPLQTRTTFGPTRAMNDSLKAAFPLDAITGLPLDGPQAKPVLLNGQVIGYTATEQNDSMVGTTPVLNPATGKWEVPLRSRVTGKAGESQVLPGAPMGAVIASAPTTTQNTAQTEVYLPTPDGGVIAQPKTTNTQSTRSRQIPGGQPLPAPQAAPTAPQAPTSLPAPAATPAKPARTGRVVEGAGKPLDSATQRELSGLSFALKQANDINDLLKNPAYSDARKAFGPAAGRITLAEINKLGGTGASPEQIDLANKLQRFLSSQAFADGGKQLTPTELLQFDRVSPKLTDTLEQALVNTRNAISFLEDRRRFRIDMLPEVQRQSVKKSLGMTDSLKPPGVTPPAGDWRAKAQSAKIGDVIDTPRGKVKKTGDNAFELVKP